MQNKILFFPIANLSNINSTNHPENQPPLGRI